MDAMPKKFPPEFKADVARVARRGDMTLAEVAADFAVSLESVRRWKRQAEIDDGVVGGLTSAEQSEIVQLRQSFLTRPSRVELTLRAQLVDVPGRRVLATRYIEVAQDAPSDDASGGVAAANSAAARALAQVAAFCVDASADLRPRTPSAP